MAAPGLYSMATRFMPASFSWSRASSSFHDRYNSEFPGASLSACGSMTWTIATGSPWAGIR